LTVGNHSLPTRSVTKRSAVLRYSSHRQKGNSAPFRKFAIYNLTYFWNVLTFFRMLDIIESTDHFKETSKWLTLCL